MREVLNTLYVMTRGAYVRLEHETLRVEVARELQLQVPLIRLEGVVCFGNVLLSPAALQRCAEAGIGVTLLDERGRFAARVEGPVRGNVLLRRAQHLALSDPERTRALARQFVAGKILNHRQVVARGAREATGEDAAALRAAAHALAEDLQRARDAATLDELRGCEGDAARTYFGVLGRLVRADRTVFGVNGRTRRPPLDRMNALLSFLYALLRAECVAALEGVGLDPQVGFLHALRPGRPALALDLMEELRPVLADRVALTLVNREQVRADDFEVDPGGGVSLTERGRRAVIDGYRKRKEETVQHPLTRETTPLGLLAHVQARLLARWLRGDLEVYLPYRHR